MRHLAPFALCLTIAACGGSTSDPVAVDSGAPEHEAAAETVDAGCVNPCAPFSVCTVCGDAAKAREDAAPEAEAEAGSLLCCQTGQNLLVCDPSSPWSCNSAVPTHPTFYCTDADAGLCGVGDPCQGFNGMGTVVVCGH